MRKEYDFSAARKNPYAAQLKKQITIRLFKKTGSKLMQQSANIFGGVHENLPMQRDIRHVVRSGMVECRLKRAGHFRQGVKSHCGRTAGQ